MLTVDTNARVFVRWRDYEKQLSFDDECKSDVLLEMMSAEVAFALWDSLDQNYMNYVDQVYNNNYRNTPKFARPKLTPIETQVLSDYDCAKLMEANPNWAIRLNSHIKKIKKYTSITSETPKGH